MIFLNPFIVISLHGLYLAWIAYGLYQKYNQSANTNPNLNLKPILRVYNILQVLINGYLVYYFYNTAFSLANPYNINNIYSPAITLGMYYHYLTKYLDFFDTIFIVLNRKWNKFSFLHLYHHSTIGLVWWWVLISGIGDGTSYFGCFINSFIHFIMYSYYFIASFTKVPKFIKSMITRAQLIQFALCLIHSFLVYNYEKKQDIFSGCSVQALYHISMIVLFGRFYIQSYFSNKKK